MPPARSSRLGRILLLMFGAGLIAIGIRYFADPALLAIESDVTAPTVKAVMEIRTVYGGLFAGLGLTLIVFGLRPAMLRAGLWLLTIGMGTVAIARLAAIALGQAPDPLFATLLAIEIAGVALAVVVLCRLGVDAEA